MSYSSAPPPPIFDSSPSLPQVAEAPTVATNAEGTPERETYTAPDGRVGRVFRIPEHNLPTFFDKVAKLSRKAIKIGVEPPTFLVVGESPKVVKRRTDIIDPETDDYLWREEVTMFQHVALFHPTVQVSGYSFVAKLEHTTEGNILHTLPGPDGKAPMLPYHFRHADPECDHCRLKRKRTDTFVLFNGDDTYTQVGRNCLGDFLGRDAELYAQVAELYYTVDQFAEASEDDGGYGGSSRPSYLMLDDYLTHVAEVIHHIGWVSRGKAKFSDKSATADVALRHIWRSPFAKKGDFLYSSPSNESGRQARAAAEWAMELPELEVEASDYLHNIQVIARRGVVGSNQFGFAASIVAGYLRHLDQLKEAANPVHKVSDYVGEIKQRRIFQLTVTKVITVQSDFGTSHLHLGVDDDGNVVKWYQGQHLEVGQRITVKATITNHQDYNGVKQTTINRAEMVTLLHYLATVEGTTYSLQALDDKDAKEQLKQILGVKRLPKGVGLSQQPLNPQDSSHGAEADTEPPVSGAES